MERGPSSASVRKTLWRKGFHLDHLTGATRRQTQRALFYFSHGQRVGNEHRFAVNGSVDFVGWERTCQSSQGRILQPSQYFLVIAFKSIQLTSSLTCSNLMSPGWRSMTRPIGIPRTSRRGGATAASSETMEVKVGVEMLARS